MIPELAVVYVAGLPANAALSGLHAFLFRMKMRSVQANLSRVGFFWSDSKSKIRRIGDDTEAKDIAAYYKTVIRLGVICFVLSWVGFFFQLLVMFSIRFLARPGLERAVLTSDLAARELTSEEVKAALSDIEALVLNAEIPQLT